MMIREYAASDHQAVVSLLQRNTDMSVAEQEQLLEQGQRLVALLDGIPRGFATLAPRRPGSYSCGMLVDTAIRRQGIGSGLWNRLLAMAPEDLRQVSCLCPATDRIGQAFLRAKGFQPWYGLELMHYSGSAFPDSGLTVRAYRDEDYDHWIRLINEGFFPMRKAMDIKPYLVYCDQTKQDPATRLKMQSRSNEDHLLFFDGGRLVGMAELENTEIDTVTVAVEHRRKGYGWRIMAHCTNVMLARGVNPVTLHVVSWNADARRLYQNMGWQFVEKQEAWRLQFGGYAEVNS